jgi:hypothetical protein
VSLPLLDAVPIRSALRVTSTIAFVPPLAAAALIAGPWRDLGDCPLDPAQLLLDCTIDALSPETAGDPLDCKPSAVAGGEGALGDALAARRGLPIRTARHAPTACRGAFDSAMAPSLDAIAMGLFGSPTPALVIALPAIGDDAAHVLETVRLSSTLDVQSAGRPDEYVVTHTLAGARFRSFATGQTGDVALTPLALPALTAYTTAITRDGLLVIDNHGFSLRLGRVARAGFGAVALAPRGVAPDAGGPDRSDRGPRALAGRRGVGLRGVRTVPCARRSAARPVASPPPARPASARWQPGSTGCSTPPMEPGWTSTRRRRGAAGHTQTASSFGTNPDENDPGLGSTSRPGRSRSGTAVGPSARFDDRGFLGVKQ